MLPVATDFCGIDPFHFGVFVCLNLVFGPVTPPVGAALFTAAALSGAKAERIAIHSLPYLEATLVILLLVVAFPGLVTAPL